MRTTRPTKPSGLTKTLRPADLLSERSLKVVQTRLRHASAQTTLEVYGHMFPDQDETTREAVAASMRLLDAVVDAQIGQKT